MKLTQLEMGLVALSQDDLPDEFTLRQFHAVIFRLYRYCECTSKRILTTLSNGGYIETIIKPTSFRVAVYRERRVKSD